jgi:ribosomal protein L21
MKKAVISTGGKQYLVTEGEELEVELLSPEKNTVFEALMVIDGESTAIGTPTVGGIQVKADIIEQIVKQDLTVWQKSFDLAKKVYLSSRELPDSERFGIISQIQRAAFSIPSNIAEGCARNNRGEYVHFIGIARGS